MITIFKKEISSFFSALIGYLVIGVFLLLTGLFLWVFPDFNILDFGYANLDSFFLIAPWIFLFLIPAITMRMFAEEKKTGTLELVFTRPITDWQLIAGKFLAGFTLVSLALLPTLAYVITLYNIADPIGNIDSGAIIGSYLGLLLLGAVFVSIGLFASSTTENQIVSFITAVFLCFFFYAAFDSLSLLQLNNQLLLILKQIGIAEHYQSISKGVIDSRDLVYFCSIIILFSVLTQTNLARRKW